ncbi:hypothetical protein CRG98_028053 [Punica granatum]|uniref:Uncharacterized protein n=1 Tax=Punica granatum TaxID=22663 RepID=A0A2I0J622_PUNGR|nr:hypothetical protein CRG98_028053 [Punica granatum]
MALEPIIVEFTLRLWPEGSLRNTGSRGSNWPNHSASSYFGGIDPEFRPFWSTYPHNAGSSRTVYPQDVRTTYGDFKPIDYRVDKNKFARANKLFDYMVATGQLQFPVMVGIPAEQRDR